MATRSLETSQRNGWTAGFVLREESPTIVRHLTDGCPTCNAGLQAFHRLEATAAVEQFEKELAAGLAASQSPVNALHAALADLVVRREHGLRR
ncbi:MAG TPA: hypothetical protein VH988_30545 [Thermoanaerobaculia bacterium]|nr:hypothetical protein [Thermoanaerobaculia bacterium]